MQIVTIITPKNSAISTYVMDDMPTTYFPCDEYEACKQLEENGWFRFFEETTPNYYKQQWKRIER